MSLFSK